MQKNKRLSWCLLATTCTVFFIVFTISLKFCDVQNDGNQNVGWATLNFWWRDVIAVNQFWVVLSDIIAVITLVVLAVVLVWQLVLLCRGRHLRALARHWWVFDITLLALALCYLVFQVVVINYRPILVNGVAEASYPSSHCLLVATVWLLVMNESNSSTTYQFSSTRTAASCDGEQ